MKKIIFPMVVFLLVTGSASAQVKRMSRHRSNGLDNSELSKPETKENKEIKNSVVVGANNTAEYPDNRTEYMQDGQLATYTGHQATAVNTDEFQSPRSNDNKKRIKR